ncbi:hypothetical protein [Rhodovulum sp. 12E13]|uniref:hypothetical protein n=1 Tax=Rhodovulum sp. 12E13 TaxID=2203891 RepID=UPI0018F2EFE0|nr:hypothetical protein [Rhodovulum sp. 12E13]
MTSPNGTVEGTSDRETAPEPRPAGTRRAGGGGASPGFPSGAGRRRAHREGLDPAGAAGLALSAVWVLVVVAVLLFFPPGAGAGPAGLGWIGTLVAIVLPVALIWVAALSARAARVMREEGARLEAAVDAIRHLAAQQQPAQGSGIRPAIEARLEEIARAQRQTEAAITRLTQAGAPVAGGPAAGAAGPGRGRVPPAPAAGPSQSRRAGQGPGGGGPVAGPAGAPATDAAQQSLALGTPEDAGEPISTSDLLRALNFPEDEADTEGFRALRAALRDRPTAGLVRSAQDILTLLAEDGIYMDDLAPDRARPEVWRRFAHGERGKGVASLGGVRDRSCLALTTGRMRQDPVFRDTAHHFLRKFDKTFAEVEPGLSDAEIVTLSETRTARAFMLLGRVSGTFD